MISKHSIKKLLIVLLLACCPSAVFARKTPSFIRRLLQESKEISYILNRPQKILPDSLIPTQFNESIHTLYKTKEGLFVSVEGTGWLYQLTDHNGEMRFNRVDSTFFTGYNFADLRFTLNGQPHSFGGYGFWKTNGILRKYDVANHGWKVILLDKELFTTFDEYRSIAQLDTSHKKIGLYNPIGVNDAVTSSGLEFDRSRNTVWVLDYNAGSWKLLGQTDKKPFLFIGASPWGSFCRFDYNKTLALVDLINNKMYAMKAGPFRTVFEKIGNTNPYAAYFSDSCLFLGDLTNDKLDSIQFKRSDFEEVGVPFYEDSSNRFSIANWVELVILTALVVYLFNKFFVSKKLKVKELNVRPPILPNQEKIETQEHFTGLEKSLLILLVQKHLQQNVASIDDLNRILGLNSKNESVQKKIRSESLNQLNQKLQLLCHSSEEAIIKQRSNFDKRSFEYQINPIYLEKIERLGIALKE